MTVGLTETLPEVALPVLKFVPTQDVALFEDQVIVEEAPLTIVLGVAVIVVVGDGGGIVAHILPVQYVPEAQSEVIVVCPKRTPLL